MYYRMTDKFVALMTAPHISVLWGQIVPNAVELQIIPFSCVEHTFSNPRLVLQCLAEHGALWTELHDRASAACTALQQDSPLRSRSVPSSSPKGTASAWPWPWPSSRHLLALFKVPSFHTFNVFFLIYFLIYFLLFILFSSFLPVRKAGIKSSFFYISPIHFSPFIIKTYWQCILHWEHPMDNVSCNIPQSIKPFKDH